jgi:hypothetical protein
MIWTADSLWQKTKLYMARAMDEDREGSLFPFWAALGLEFLGRCTLATVHPALLADPQDDGKSLVYAFGHGTTKAPRSIPTKTVFKRCQKIVPKFTEDEFAVCMSMAYRRNEELHSGSPAFDELPTHIWMGDFFRICKTLLAFQGKTLADLFGEAEAEAADKMIKGDKKNLKKAVLKSIADATSSFASLNTAEKKENRIRGRSESLLRKGTTGKPIVCPACRASGLLTGEPIRATEPKLYDEHLVVETAFLATTFQCFSCALLIEGHDKLSAADLGGQYSLVESYDPKEYYGVAPDYYEDEYMNE